MKPAPLVAVLGFGLGLLALAGCGGSGGGTSQLDPLTAAVQDTAGSDALLAQTLDAANEALVINATNSTEKVITNVATRPGDRMSSVDLPRTAVDFPIDISTLKDAAGAPRFPNCSGSIHVQSNGVVVPSWPTGSGAVASFNVTVLFDVAGGVTFTDPNAGSVTNIASGSYTYTLSTSYTHTSTNNWVLNLDTSNIIPSGSPLTATVTRSGYPTRTVSMFGARDVHLILTRFDDGGANNTYTVDGTVDGNPDGVTNVDTGSPSLSFTNWDFTINGSDHVVWNRHANLTYHYDFIANGLQGAPVIDQTSDEIFLTVNGTKMGPYTAAQLITAFHATAK